MFSSVTKIILVNKESSQSVDHGNELSYFLFC